MEPLVANAPVLKASVVTLDVLHSGVLWGWYVTMNFWAKSISTGVILLAPWVLASVSGGSTEPPVARLTALPRSLMQALRGGSLRAWIAVISLVALSVTLLFTVLDLHQPFRFWHIFAHTHLTSVLALGAWTLTIFNGLLVVLIALAALGRPQTYDRLLRGVWIVAFLGTIYTAGLLGQANARELWHTATELPQMVFAATLAGAAVFLLIPRTRALPWLPWVLSGSALLSLSIYVAEVIFAPQKSEEAAYIVHRLLSGELLALFVGGLVLGFVLPSLLALVAVRARRPALLAVASVFGLIGLWLVKHAWLIAPQLIPLS